MGNGKKDFWARGDGWYADGPQFAFDYYSSYVFHPMYLETLQNMIDSRDYTRIHYRNYFKRALNRTRKFSLVLERMISPEGTFPVFGRSIPYRLATMQPLALMAWRDQLPDGVTRAQVRAALPSLLDGCTAALDSGEGMGRRALPQGPSLGRRTRHERPVLIKKK